MAGDAEIDEVRLTTSDGETLEAEYCGPIVPGTPGIVLCHPHPLYGGSMRSLVISPLFRALGARGHRVLRFNFRGVERSTGHHDDGKAEQLDALAAVEHLRSTLPTATPIVVVGFSFGADVALSLTDASIVGWCAIAPPLRFAHSTSAATDPRPKLVVLAGNDDFRPASEVEAITATWPAARTVVVPGASHFFVGRDAMVVEEVGAYCASFTAPPGAP